MVGLEHYLGLAAALFVIGIFGLFLNRKNVIVLLMSIELMLLAVNINLVAFSTYLGDLHGPGLHPVRAHRRRRRGRHRPGDPGQLLPRPRHDRGGRRQRDERLSPDATIILFAPLIGALIAGFGHRVIGDKGAQYAHHRALVPLGHALELDHLHLAARGHPAHPDPALDR